MSPFPLLPTVFCLLAGASAWDKGIFAVGSDHACAMPFCGSDMGSPDCKPTCWGKGADGQTTVPDGVAFVELAAGSHHTCGLDASGVASCWGYGAEGQTNPATAARFSSLALGDIHSCGLTLDAEVACWGGNSRGQTDVPQIEGNATWLEVASGLEHTCALSRNETDGVRSIYCWGRNTYGQLEAPSTFKCACSPRNA
tara:strand:+ start:271 stop:864 length:594 start_codon:yes stop_codon:yes gene_type:complete